jgi:outer membrane biogenesis lipoprotein LolB
MRKFRRIAAGLATTGLLAAGIAAPSAGAAVVGGGLVNVGVDVNNNNILDNNEVAAQVPVAVAANVLANICGVDIPVSVLAQQVAGGNQATCDATTGGTAIAQRGIFKQ